MAKAEREKQKARFPAGSRPTPPPCVPYPQLLAIRQYLISGTKKASKEPWDSTTTTAELYTKA
jgi:hypothetical protein